MSTEKRAPRVLAIDDDPITLGVVKRDLADLSITTASSGEEGLEKISRATFDLVLLDIVMPGIDGLTVLREIRRSMPTKILPVLMLTVLADQKTIEEAYESGADDYLVKPISVWELRARVNVQIERHRMWRSMVDRGRWRAMERIATGLSHEINNPLFIIHGFTQLLMGELDGPAKTYAQNLLKATEQVATITRKIISQVHEPAGHP